MLCYALIVVVTIAYFVPRDLMLFRGPVTSQLDEVRAAVGQWRRMNWARTLLGCAGVLCSSLGLDQCHRLVRSRLSSNRRGRPAKNVFGATRKKSVKIGAI